MAVYNIYFSPTGGTKKVSCILSGAICEDFNDIDLMKKCDINQHFEKDDVCVISVPAFGGRVPDKAVEKIEGLKGNGAKAILVAVFGNRAIDDTLAELYDISVNAGFNVVAGVEAVAEHSLARMYGNGRPDSDDKRELEDFAKEICIKINEDKCGTIEIPGNRPYKEFRATSMKPVVDESCINCKKCARECPKDAISMNNVKDVDANKCFSCMHCVVGCPKKARHNAPDIMSSFEERLRDRCAGRKSNRLYIKEI